MIRSAVNMLVLVLFIAGAILSIPSILLVLILTPLAMLILVAIAVVLAVPALVVVGVGAAIEMQK